MDEEKLVPKLRFSGFDEEWIKVPAGEIFKNVSNKNHDGTLPILAVTQDKGVVPRDSIDFDIKTSEKSVKSYKIIEPGDYVISLRSFQGGIEYSYIKGICSPAYTILKPKRDIYDDFYKFYLKKDEFISRLNYAVIGIRDGKQISYKDFSEIKIPYTSVEEQKRISEFLNLIEHKIQLLTKKHMEYQNFKKYLMQQIFAQKLRFDFDIVKLKNISKINKGKQLNKDSMIEDGQYYVLNGGKEPSGYTNEWNTPENTITISEGGNSCGFVNFNVEKFWSGGHCYYLSNLNENINDYYLYSYLKFKEDLIMRLRVGSGLPNIQKGDIENFKVQVPSNENQNKISNLLFSTDKKIDSILTQKDNFETFKKGLLQQMFI